MDSDIVFGAFFFESLRSLRCYHNDSNDLINSFITKPNVNGFFESCLTENYSACFYNSEVYNTNVVKNRPDLTDESRSLDRQFSLFDAKMKNK